MAIDRPARRLAALLLASGLITTGCVVVPAGHGGDLARESAMLGPASCRTDRDARFDRTLPAKPDPSLMEQAIRASVNAERCRRGLDPLGGSPAALRAATDQAAAMARHGFVGHRSPVRGRETFVRRLGAAQARFRLAGETVARTPLFAVEGRPYEVVDARRCSFRQTGGGPPIPRHTYRLAADRLVLLWMNSPDHRIHLLNRRYKTMGSAAAVRLDSGLCGEIWGAAVFLG